MTAEHYSDVGYGQPTIPPATPPAIDPGASPRDAAELALDNGDSHAPGSQPAHFERGREDAALFDGSRADGGDRIEPAEQPDEIVPDEGDTVQPGGTPDEVSPDQGDFDRPDTAPVEMPPQPDTAPVETPAPD